MGEVNTLGPMASPELPPAMSYAVVLLPPLSVSLSCGTRLSADARRRERRGPRRFWATLSIDTHALWAAVFFRAGPAVAD